MSAEIELIYIEPEQALGEMLLNDAIMLNCHHWREDFSKEDRESIYVSVMCSDTFYYACADAEQLPYEEIASLYSLWKHNNMLGPVAWCVKRRKQMPIGPKVELLKSAGFNLEKLIRGEL